MRSRRGLNSTWCCQKFKCRHSASHACQVLRTRAYTRETQICVPGSKCGQSVRPRPLTFISILVDLPSAAQPMHLSKKTIYIPRQRPVPPRQDYQEPAKRPLITCTSTLSRAQNVKPYQLKTARSHFLLSVSIKARHTPSLSAR